MNQNDEKDAKRYQFLSKVLTLARAGGGIEVNDKRQIYEEPVPGEEVRLYWYPITPVGFQEYKGRTIDEVVDAAMEEWPEVMG